MKSFVYSLVVFSLLSCQAKQETAHASLDLIEPKQLLKIEDAIGDHYFGFIGFNTVVLNNGHILIPDLEQAAILLVNEKGTLIGVSAKQGAGPGEVRRIDSIQKSKTGGVAIYDSGNQKILIFNEFGYFSDEFLITPEIYPLEDGYLDEVFHIGHDDFLFLFSDWGPISNIKTEYYSELTTYNRTKGLGDTSIRLRTRIHALIDGGGASATVPFTPRDLVGVNPKTGDVFAYWSDDSRIAQLSSSFDTTKTIDFTWNRSEVSKAELDTIKVEYQEYWKSMASKMPKIKAIASDFIVDEEGQFWLHLNESRKDQIWLVIDATGKPVRKIKLPEGARLTHVSKQHIGVALEENVFALYENK